MNTSTSSHSGLGIYVQDSYTLPDYQPETETELDLYTHRKSLRRRSAIRMKSIKSSSTHSDIRDRSSSLSSGSSTSSHLNIIIYDDDIQLHHQLTTYHAHTTQSSSHNRISSSSSSNSIITPYLTDPDESTVISTHQRMTRQFLESRRLHRESLPLFPTEVQAGYDIPDVDIVMARTGRTPVADGGLELRRSLDVEKRRDLEFRAWERRCKSLSVRDGLRSIGGARMRSR